MPDLEAVITEAISGLDRGSEPAAPAAETPVTETVTESTETPADIPTTPEAAAPAAGDTVAETPEVKPGETTPPEDSLETVRQELAGKRDNRIPYSRVTKIVENAEKKARAESQVRITELEAEVTPYRSDEFKNSMRALELAESDPAKFIELLAKSDERYAKLLKTAAAPAAASVSNEDIQPNIQLTDGTLGYDATAVNQLLAKQAAALEAKFEARFGELKPIKEQHETNTLRAQAAERVAVRLQEASKWPGFNESAKEIADHMEAAYKKTGQKVDLRDAYIAVVMPKMQADETRIRQKIADEQKKAAKATSGVTPAAAAAPAAAPAVPEGMDPVEAAIRRSIANLK